MTTPTPTTIYTRFNNAELSTRMKEMETGITTQLNAMTATGGELSAPAMVALQYQMQRLQLYTNFLATMNQDWSQTIKAILNKIS